MLPPASTLYIGSVGADTYADTLRSACTAAGVRTEYHISPSNPTGRCGVIITGHHRSMVTHLAAANDYQLSHLQSPPIWALATAARVYFVGGYHLTVCPDAAMALAHSAARANKIFVLSLSAPFIAQFFTEALDATVPFWDYVLGNEEEVRAYAEGHGWGTGDVRAIAKRMAGLPKENARRKRVVVVTQGTEETVVAVEGEGEVRGFGVREVEEGKIVDTNGAG